MFTYERTHWCIRFLDTASVSVFGDYCCRLYGSGSIELTVTTSLCVLVTVTSKPSRQFMSFLLAFRLVPIHYE